MTDLADLTDELMRPGSQFKSLTAQKLMAGLSFNSIDTLLEVNAAAEESTTTTAGAAAQNNNNHIMNQSTETVDFGVI